MVVDLPSARILIHPSLPFARIEPAGGVPLTVAWPDAPLPRLGTRQTVWPSPTCAWIVYSEVDIADFPGPRRSTAVGVSSSGAITTLDLGSNLTPIGTDSLGLWVLEEQSVERPIAVFEAARGSMPPSVDHLPLENPEDVPRFVPPPMEPNPDREPGIYMFGARGWERAVPPPEVQPDDVIPGRPTSPSFVRRLADNGRTESIRFDRSVVAMEEDGGRLRVAFYPTEPGSATADGLGLWYYHRQAIDLDLTALSTEVRVNDFPIHDLGARSAWEEFGSQQTSAVDRAVELDVPPDTSWTVREIDPRVRDHTIEWAENQLRAIGMDRAAWTRADNAWHRVRSPFRDLEVTTELEWPYTVVRAEFNWHPWGSRVRAELRVFDAAGRPNVHQYATVYLDEDLATMPKEGFSVGSDGAIEVPIGEASW